MKNVFAAFLVVVPVAGCAAQVSPTGATLSPVIPMPPGAGAPGPNGGMVGPAYGPGEDQHWFQADDYMISDRPFEEGWIYVKLAKMKQAPSPATRGEGLFFVLTETKDEWTKHYYLTRPATPADLVLGALVICFEGNEGDGVYRAPQNRNEARQERWFMSRITDLAELYKHAVGVDTYKCAPDALRVPVR